MITHCEECKTYFRVNIEQLRAANGQVKCGRCMNVFNALESLIEQHDEEESPSDLDMGRKLFQKDSLTSKPASSQTADQSDTRDTSARNSFRFPSSDHISEPLEAEFSSQSSRFNPINEAGSETSSLFDKQPDLLSENIDELELQELSIPQDSIYNTPVKDTNYSTPLWIAASMFLLGFLFYQYFQFNVATKKPSGQVFCGVFDCSENNSPIDVSKINLTSRDIREHPQLSNVLLVNLTLVNNAAFEQAFPRLQLDLFDNSGRAVGSRRFIPSEYLDDSIDPLSMKPDQPVHIVLEMVGSSAIASSFEFTFL